jgi:hypothetical protein
VEKFIFITPETFDYSPDGDRPEPDYFDLQTNSVGRDDMFQNAFEDLIELNTGAGPVRSFKLDYNRHNFKYFSFRSQRDKLPIAS